MSFFRKSFPVLLLIIFGIATTAYFIQKRNVYQRCTIPVEATIIDLETIFEYTQSEHRGQTRQIKGYWAKCSYTATDSTVTVLIFLDYSGRKRMLIREFLNGESKKIQLMYNPDKPEEAIWHP